MTPPFFSRLHRYHSFIAFYSDYSFIVDYSFYQIIALYHSSTANQACE